MIWNACTTAFVALKASVTRRLDLKVRRYLDLKSGLNASLRLARG